MKRFAIAVCVALIALTASAQTHIRIHTSSGFTDVELADFDSITFITVDPGDHFNGHEYVDLGLPSGLLWSTLNVGAKKITDYGNYFAWGETAPKESYTWDTYKYCQGSNKTLTKYNCTSTYGSVDNKTTLEPMDDAASKNFGGDWRMPTNAEMEELFSAANVTWEWITIDNVYGYQGKSVRNGATIFLPAAGSMDGTSVNWSSDISGENAYGRYWASSLYTVNNVNFDGYFWWFNKNKAQSSGTYRCYGRPVRPVIEPEKK